MIAVDTNLLVYAHRADMPQHVPAAAALRVSAEGVTLFASLVAACSLQAASNATAQIT
jgi:predicted nucleic acid-binding protein